MNKKLIFGIILGAAAVVLLVWFVINLKWLALIPAALMVIMVVCPLVMRRGRDIVTRERTAFLNQISADLPAEFDRKKVRKGYVMMLLFLWIAPALTMLIPGGTVWIAAFVPVSIVCLIAEIAVSKTWRDFRFSISAYWFMNIGIVTALSAAMFALRALIGYA